MTKVECSIDVTKKADRLVARFTANMQRIGSLARLATSGQIDLLKPISFGKYEGAAADVFRSAVVFLHAAFEDVLRSHLSNPDKRLTFSSGSDIDKALHRSNIDPAPFRHLYRPLTQMARRRERIVHHADLPAVDATAVEPWNMTDQWQFCMWNLAVLAFYYQLLASTNSANEVQTKVHERIRKAMTAHVDYGHALIEFGNAAPRRKETGEEPMDWLNRLSGILANLSAHTRKISSLLDLKSTEFLHELLTPEEIDTL